MSQRHSVGRRALSSVAGTRDFSTSRAWRPAKRLISGTVDSFRQETIHPAAPVILPNEAFHEFPAVTKWFRRSPTAFNTSYLGQYADVMIPLELTIPASASPLNSENTIFQRTEAPLGLFFDWAEAASSHTMQRLYVAQAPVLGLPKALQDDLPTPELIRSAGKGDVYNSSIWLGVAPTKTPLHRDPNPNLYLQLAGHKVFRLLKPEIGLSVFTAVQTLLGESASGKFRGEEMMDGKGSTFLEDKIWSADGKGDFTLPSGLEAVLAPGDLLYIPLGWWHSVRSTGSGITGSVNWWFR